MTRKENTPKGVINKRALGDQATTGGVWQLKTVDKKTKDHRPVEGTDPACQNQYLAQRDCKKPNTEKGGSKKTSFTSPKGKKKKSKEESDGTIVRVKKSGSVTKPW